MSKKKKWVIIISLVFVLVFASFIYYRINENLKAAQKQTKPLISVETILPERGDIADELTFSGDILAIQQTNIELDNALSGLYPYMNLRERRIIKQSKIDNAYERLRP